MDIVVHEWGAPDAPPLLLVHGLLEAGTGWPDAVARWAPRWHVLAVDLRGHGASPRWTERELPHMTKVWMDDLVGVLMRQPGPVPIVGHSLGGRLAAIAGKVCPQLVSGLVLEDPALTWPSVTPPDYIDAQQQFLDEMGQRPQLQIRRMRAESTWSDAEIEAWAASKPLVDRAMVDELNLGRIDGVGILNELTVPTLLLWDSDGTHAFPDWAVMNKQVHVERMDNVGHCLRRDNPEGYYALVDPFLESLRPSRDAGGQARR